MKTSKFFSVLIAALIVVMFSCKKEDAPDPNQIVDIDGNVYHSVVIGNQTWLVENLKVTHFNDGAPIPLVEDQTKWNSLPSTASPGFCYYDNKIENKKVYGCLYNWYCVRDAKIAPAGYHVANNCDWITIMNYFGGLDFAGDQFKSSDFAAKLGGYRGDKYYDIGKSTSMMSADLYSGVKVLAISAYFDEIHSNYGAGGMETGLSIRCVKNNTVTVTVNK
jgi:uncharacterized protein (TIGR02145 family)